MARTTDANCPVAEPSSPPPSRLRRTGTYVIRRGAKRPVIKIRPVGTRIPSPKPLITARHKVVAKSENGSSIPRKTLGEQRCPSRIPVRPGSSQVAKPARLSNGTGLESSGSGSEGYYSSRSSTAGVITDSSEDNPRVTMVSPDKQCRRRSLIPVPRRRSAPERRHSSYIPLKPSSRIPVRRSSALCDHCHNCLPPSSTVDKGQQPRRSRIPRSRRLTRVIKHAQRNKNNTSKIPRPCKTKVSFPRSDDHRPPPIPLHSRQKPTRTSRIPLPDREVNHAPRYRKLSPIE